MKNYILFFLGFLLLGFTANAQRNCASMQVLDQQLKDDPSMLLRMQIIEKQTSIYEKSPHIGKRSVVVIPVVIHVVYKTTAQNISEAQINSQFTALNADYRALNSDLANVPSEFQSLIGDAEVEFCLAKQDPNGNATTGIERKYVNKTSWGTNDDVKKLSKGGLNPLDATKYLNIWVCNIGGGILGYAQFPGGSNATDGVVIGYNYFGTTGAVAPPFDKGRTATHEIGHWLNLRHIWGDANCGTDYVSDTPTANAENYGCPSFPHYSTCSGTPKELTMDYMDYTDDACMYMFTEGQKTRMRAVLDGGARASLASSSGCDEPGGGGGSCGTPTGLAVSSITSNSASVIWGAVSGATSYNLQYKTNASGTWTNISTTTAPYTLTGLSASTIYNTKVQAVCGGTLGAFCNQVNFTTLAQSNCTDAYESNNTKSTAKTMPTTGSINALISSTSDVDWFKFTTTSSKKNVKVTMTNLPNDYDLKLYKSSSLVAVSENAGNADEQCIYNTSSTGTYYVYVYGWNGNNDPNNCYNLSAAVSSSSFRTDGSEESVAFSQIENEFLVWPNPAKNEVNIKVPFDNQLSGEISIFDVSGKTIYSQKLLSDKEHSNYKIEVSNFEKGLYFLKWKTETQNLVQKMIISK